MNFTWKYGKIDIDDCCFVRKKVFIEEQGFDSSLEFDSIDEIAYHLLGSENENPIATARLFYDGNCFHAGRICILKEYRGKNIGLSIMNEVENKTIELGGNLVELSAQVGVVNFYEKAGYTKFGNEYLDEHCLHIMMRKII